MILLKRDYLEIFKTYSLRIEQSRRLGNYSKLKIRQIDISKIILAIVSGLLLTGSFPKIGVDLLAWFAIVPLLVALRNLSFKNGFRLGFLSGLVHYLTLMYWLVYTMKTYGHLPLYLCIPVLFLFSAYLALYIAIFSAILTGICRKPIVCFFMIPVLWVSLEYLRSFLFSGFPWELIGYSQFNNLYLIQISDIFGIYGVSFLIALSNAAIFITFLYLTKKNRQEWVVSKSIVARLIIFFILIFGLVWFYGKWRIESIDNLISASPSVSVTIVQGNIDQEKKWDTAFQNETTEKYIKLSLLAKEHKPDLIVWPETATPFYFLYDIKLSNMVQKGIYDIDADFLIGSPSFVRSKNSVEYYNSAYLISSSGKVSGKYDKVHLVPFGEYIPFKKWFPFLGKMVEQVGDFRAGNKGNTISFRNYELGLQICYEIIFPDLSRAMTKNNALLLVNITNDAWFGKTGAPYQHFSMAVFRAVENRRSLVRSANTGISGFIDPAGRVIAQTDLFQEAVMTKSMPLLNKTSLYTRFGDIFAIVCLIATAILIMILYGRPLWSPETTMISKKKI